MLREKHKKIIAGGMIFILFLIVIIMLFKTNNVSTDNAYLKADIITIRPKVSGYITEVFISDNQVVKAGQSLAKIDDQDYKAKFAQVEARVSGANAKIDILANKLVIQGLAISQVSFNLDSAKIILERAEKDLKRAENLVKDKTISQQDLEKSQETQHNSKNKYESARLSLKASMIENTVIAAEYEEAKALLTAYQNERELAKIDLENTIIKAAADGVVSKRALQVGQLASPSIALAYLVQNNIWVLANFKEVQVGAMQANQLAIINIDSLAGKKFRGRVESLSPATGSEFSILPPENATGNFTKIVQRVPVKIIFEPDQDLSLLKTGLSCEVKVELK